MMNTMFVKRPQTVQKKQRGLMGETPTRALTEHSMHNTVHE